MPSQEDLEGWFRQASELAKSATVDPDLARRYGIRRDGDYRPADADRLIVETPQPRVSAPDTYAERVASFRRAAEYAQQRVSTVEQQQDATEAEILRLQREAQALLRRQPPVPVAAPAEQPALPADLPPRRRGRKIVVK